MSNQPQPQRFSVSQAFGIPEIPDEVEITGLSHPTAHVPQRKDYLFEKNLLSDILGWIMIGGDDGLLLSGPTGCGKTSVIEQIYARLNMPLQSVNGHDKLETPDLIGHQTFIDGDLVFQHGPLALAMKYGHGFILNEMDYLDPGTAAGLNQILDGGMLTIPENGGEVIHPAEGFRFIATANTNGGGDLTGRYLGTQQQNLAWMDRFWVVECDYMDPTQEEALLRGEAPGVPTEYLDQMVGVGNEIRRLFMGDNSSEGALEVTMSTRTLLRWGRLTQFFAGKAQQGISPIHYAFDRALGNRANPETKAALHEVLQRHFGDAA